MKKAFTIVEIMIVVVIIGLLAAMAIPAFQKVKERARQNELGKKIAPKKLWEQRIYFVSANTGKVVYQSSVSEILEETSEIVRWKDIEGVEHHQSVGPFISYNIASIPAQK